MFLQTPPLGEVSVIRFPRNFLVNLGREKNPFNISAKGAMILLVNTKRKKKKSIKKQETGKEGALPVIRTFLGQGPAPLASTS